MGDLAEGASRRGPLREVRCGRLGVRSGASGSWCCLFCVR